MGSPERTRSSVKETEEGMEVNVETLRDEEDWCGDDMRKQQSSRYRKSGSSEEVDGLNTGGRERVTSDRHESRKKVSSSSRVDNDQDDYGTVKESHTKQLKRKTEENTLDVLSTWYQDGEGDNKLEITEKPGNSEYGHAEESERNNSSKVSDRDSRDLAGSDNIREKGHGYTEHGRKHRRRWDEPDNVGITVEHGEKFDVKSSQPSDPKLENVSQGEGNDTLETEWSGFGSKDSESMNDKNVKSLYREERQIDSDKSKRGRSEFLEGDHKGNLREDASNKEKFEEHRQSRKPNRDATDGSRSLNTADDASTWTRDKNRRESIEHTNTSRNPEKTGRRQSESDNLEMDHERSSSHRKKEQGKDGSWDDRSKGRDDSWGDRNRDRQNVKDSWKRKQEKESRDNETNYDNIRDWELPRRGRDRIDGRSGGRKDGSRTEAVKTSSKYGISNDNYDVIEIQRLQTKSFDYGREENKPMCARNGDPVQQSDAKGTPDNEELAYLREERLQNTHGSIHSGEDTKDRVMDSGFDGQEQYSWREDDDFQADKARAQRGGVSSRYTGSQTSGGSVPSHGNQESGSFNRNASQGARGNRTGRIGRGRPPGRDNHQTGIPIPLAGSPFGPLGLPPPGLMQSLPPNMSPAPGPISPGVFIPPFQPPISWPGGRGAEMNMLGLPPVPPGPLGPRFSSNMGNSQSGSMVFNPSGPVTGMPPNNFNAMSPVVRGPPQASGGWIPPRTNVPHGKAPSRGEQNDYSQNFVDTGMRPQNFIRELELTSVVEDYPKLRELIQKKDEIVAKSASHPMYYKCDLREQMLSPDFFGTKFDVILVDPPWEEYVHRAPGVTDHMEYWTFEEIMNLKIEAIADTPSFIFLWVGAGVGLEQGRQCLKKWGFRRCEDICWVKTNKTNATPGLRHDSHTLFQRSKEHCLMGIKGTVRRSTDGHIIHANIDTDVIIAEEPPYGSTAKPEDMYRIIEHFALGRRRLELFGEDHNIRSGWLTIGTGLSSSNFNSEAYTRNFADKDGKVWAGGGGRNPPPEAPHLVLTTPDIESLRPKSPMKNQQQQSASISLTTPNSGNKRPTGNSPQNCSAPNMNQENCGSNIPSPAPWGSPMEPFQGGREGALVPPSDDRMFDMYGYNNAAAFGPVTGEFPDYESHRGMNML